MNYSQEINKQYGQTDLSSITFNALEEAGKNLDALTLKDLAPFDQLHAGGAEVTRKIALSTTTGISSVLWQCA